MKFLSTLSIRPLGPEDAEKFLHVHHAAVHNTANADYAPDVLDAWSGPVSDARIQRYNASADEEVRIGAFDGATMAGLGAIVPLKSELRACYVHPDYGRMGVGRRIVDALEQTAIGMGLSTLSLDSSITAEKFYAQLGYTVVERGSHRLGDGTFIASIRMQKQLSPIGDLDALKKRNARVEGDKAWETSWARRLSIAALTYVTLVVYLPMLGLERSYLHATVPVIGYLLSTLTLRFLKTKWLDAVYNKEPKA